MISFKQLTYALAAGKTLHFKKAAELCNISQSALSTALSDMEKSLGIAIFERDNKKVLVTPLGEKILQKAHQIVQQMDDLERIADTQKAPLSFPLNIGVIPTIAPYLLPLLLPLLQEHYPQAHLNIVEEQSHVLVEMVQSGEIDSAILALPYPCDNLLCLEFWEEDFYWISQENHQHAERREITSTELELNELMLLKEGHCLKDHVLDICDMQDQTANHGFGAASLTTLVQMVAGGMGTTLIPAMALEQFMNQNLKLAAVHVNEHSPHRRIAFVIRPNYTRISSIEALMAISRQALGQ